MKPKNRKTTTPIKVCVLPEERTFIQEQAKLCGRTTSTYLRDLALGYKPQSKTDLDVVIERALEVVGGGFGLSGFV